jgi:hypothetical protein
MNHDGHPVAEDARHLRGGNEAGKPIGVTELAPSVL